METSIIIFWREPAHRVHTSHNFRSMKFAVLFMLFFCMKFVSIYLFEVQEECEARHTTQNMDIKIKLCIHDISIHCLRNLQILIRSWCVWTSCDNMRLSYSNFLTERKWLSSLWTNHMEFRAQTHEQLIFIFFFHLSFI